MQPSNCGSYLPVDTQERAVSGRASSMPRLTVDPQVKPGETMTNNRTISLQEIHDPFLQVVFALLEQ